MVQSTRVGKICRPIGCARFSPPTLPPLCWLSAGPGPCCGSGLASVGGVNWTFGAGRPGRCTPAGRCRLIPSGIIVRRARAAAASLAALEAEELLWSATVVTFHHRCAASEISGACCRIIAKFLRCSRAARRLRYRRDRRQHRQRHCGNIAFAPAGDRGRLNTRFHALARPFGVDGSASFDSQRHADWKLSVVSGPRNQFKSS